MDIVQCKDATDAADRAAVILSRELTERTEPVLVLLSGGSALNILDALRPDVFTSRVTVGVLDERVSNAPAENNFLQLADHPLIKQAIINGAGTIDTVALAGETPKQLAMRFEGALRDWKSQHAGGSIIATVGMGPDGHTFGMMPYPEDPDTFSKQFIETDRWVAGDDAGDKNQYPLRATTTVVFSREIDMSIWYVCGESKTDMLKRALDPRTRTYAVPARIIQDMNDVTLFTDCTL